jgi:hypothetical protein
MHIRKRRSHVDSPASSHQPFLIWVNPEVTFFLLNSEPRLEYFLEKFPLLSARIRASYSNVNIQKFFQICAVSVAQGSEKLPLYPSIELLPLLD